MIPPSQKLETLVNGVSATDIQIGGSHYKTVAIQPVEYISANKLNFLEGCIVKRITRWRSKDGITDLLKIKHEVDLLIQMEKQYNNLIAPAQQSAAQSPDRRARNSEAAAAPVGPPFAERTMDLDALRHPAEGMSYYQHDPKN